MRILLLFVLCIFLCSCSPDNQKVTSSVGGHTFEFMEKHLVTSDGFEVSGLDSSEGHIVVRMPIKDLLGDSSLALNETESMGMTLWASKTSGYEVSDSVSDAWQRKGRFSEAVVVEKHGLFFVDSGVHVGVFRISPVLMCGEICAKSWVGVCTRWDHGGKIEAGSFSDKDGCIGRMHFKGLNVQYDFPARHLSRLDFVHESIVNYLESSLVSEPE